MNYTILRTVAILLFGVTTLCAQNDNTVATAEGADANKFLLSSIFTENPIIAVDYTPDGKMMVTGGANRTLDVWNPKTGKLWFSLEGHTDDILAVACSPNGRLVATGGVDKKIIIWDLATESKVVMLEGHDDYVRDLEFSPDGKKLISGSWDRTAVVWDVISGLRLQTLSGHRDNVTSVAFNEDGTKVMTGCGDHLIRIWEIETGELLKVMEGHTDEIWDVKWSNNSRFAASGAWDNKARVWDVETGEQVMVFPGHVTDVWSVAFNPDAMMLATSGGDRTVKLWDLATGKQICNLSGKVHTSDVEEVIFSPDGANITSVSRDGSIRIWKSPTLAERIDMLTEQEVEKWSVKQDFEKTAAYEKRMKEKDDYFADIQNGVITKVVDYYAENVDWTQGIELGEYNADLEFYFLQTQAFGELKLEVPINQAKLLRDNFDRIAYKRLKLEYVDGEIMVNSITAYLKGLNIRHRISSMAMQTTAGK